MMTCFILSLWYLDMYELKIVSIMILESRTEGLLAISEHLLIIAQLAWLGSLSPFSWQLINLMKRNKLVL